MKQPKKLTRSQMEIVWANNLEARDYMFVADINESYMKIIHKEKKTIKIVDKTRRKKKWN